MPLLTTYGSASKRGFAGEAFNPIINTVVYYDFFNTNCYPGTGTTVFDLSGNGYNGTVTNATFSNTPGGDAQGSFGFNGTDTIISTPSGITQLYATGPLTYQIWFKVNNTATLQSLFFKGNNNSNFPSLSVETSNIAGTTLFAETTDTTNGINTNFGNTLLTPNTWYLITWVTSPNPSWSSIIYQNTTSLTRGPTNTYNAFTENNPLIIGASYYGNIAENFLNGRVGTFIAYNRALSATDVSNVFNATKKRFGY